MKNEYDKSMTRTTSTRGFTLVEIMLVVIIIGVLAGAILPRFAGQTERAKSARARSDIAAIGLALDLYELDMGQYPSEKNWKEALTGTSPPSGLSSEQSDQWHGPYLKRGLPPHDPWGREYEYKLEGGDYKLSSRGSDGQPGNDDIKSWE